MQEDSSQTIGGQFVCNGQNNGKDWSVAIESGAALTTRRRSIYRVQSGLHSGPARRVSIKVPAN